MADELRKKYENEIKGLEENYKRLCENRDATVRKNKEIITEINYKDKKAFERITHLDEEISNF